ncbi:hypothetical protein FRC00_010573 [Tulasnella sp. 408]|nr:hypothetical protein FRC00_010573 [Tulasnella sp. 408]
MDVENKTLSMPTTPSFTIPTPTTPSAPPTAGSKGSTIMPMSPISSGFASPNQGTTFPDVSPPGAMPSPSMAGDHLSQQAGFNANLPSPPPHTSPAGFFIPGPRDHQSQPRNLILCFDGTAKYFNDGNTNVIRLFQGLDKMKTDEQLCYYQPGIAGMLHIFLARQLADPGLKVGLLPKSNEEQIPFAYSLYKDKSDDGVQKAHGFKKAFSRHVSIEFMGVWDTVTSVGLAGRTLPFTSHNAVVKTFRQAFALDERRAKFRHNPWSRAAFDGPPPDESRPPAMPNPLNRFRTRRQSVDLLQSDQPQQNQEQLTFSGGVKRVGTAIRNTLLLRRKTDPRHYRSDNHAQDQHAWQCPDCNFPWGQTNSREVWFAGSHSGMGRNPAEHEVKLTHGRFVDVGGGEVNTSKEKHKNNLSNPSLLWMIQQIDAHADALGLRIHWVRKDFDDIPTVKAYFDAKAAPPSSKPSSPTGTESKLPQQVLDELQKDVKGKLHDTLRGITPWWLLEFIPLWKHFLDGNKQQCKELK